MLEVVGVVFLLTIVGFAVFGLFMAFYWEPGHRPLVVIPPPDGATIEIDGKAVCTNVPRYTDEQSLRACVNALPTGHHTIVTRSAGGAELHKDVVDIARGGATYAASHELPTGKCLVLATYDYATVAIAIPGSGPRRDPVAAGVVELGRIDDVLVEPPRSMQSKDSNAARVALRLIDCPQ